MAFSVFLYIVFMVIATKAGPCLDNQQCSECDNTTGHCLTDCDIGYFDLKCLSVCDGHCKGNLCNQSADGSGRCTEGCEPGYQGQRCNILCDSPGDNCTACPGGCDGGYCQLDSSCVSGCVDSHYGTGCYNTCSANCRRNPFALEGEPSVMIQSDCHRSSGECIFGCKHGWHGTRCSSKYDRTEIIYAITVGVPIATVLIISLAVCIRFCKCKCRCCRRGSQAESAWDNEFSLDSEWSLEADQCHSKMGEDQRSTCQGAGGETFDGVYSAPGEGLVSDRGHLEGGYSSIEEGQMSDRRNVAYSSPVYTGETVVRYIAPVQERH